MSRRRRLLCIYQHAPTPGAPGIYRHRVWFSELARRNWHVDLVSTPVNYMTGRMPERYDGKLYLKEVIDGILHHWVWASADIHSSRARRALNYLTFAATATIRASTLPRPDVIFVSSPPLSVEPAGVVLARRFRRPWILEIRDPWPEGAVPIGWLSEESRLYRILIRVARRIESGADWVVVPSPGLVDIARAHGARNVTVLTGGVRRTRAETGVRELARRSLDVEEEACLFVYVGAHGVVNGLDVLLDAAASLPPDHPADFLLVGDGSDRVRIEKRAAELRIPRLRLLGAVPDERVRDLLAASDVCLHVLRADPFFSYTLPTKILRYFEAHRPFITTVAGVPERLARESGGGFASSPEALTEELLRWTTMAPSERAARGEQSFRYGREHFSLESSIDRLEELLLRVMR